MSNGTKQDKKAATRSQSPNTYENMRKVAREYLVNQVDDPKAINGLDALRKLEEVAKDAGERDKIVAAAFYLLATNSQLGLFIQEW